MIEVGVDLIQQAVESHTDRVCQLTRALRLMKTEWPSGLPESWIKSVNLNEGTIKFEMDGSPVRMGVQTFYKQQSSRTNLRSLHYNSHKEGLYLFKITVHNVDEVREVKFHLEEESRDRNAWIGAWKQPIHAFNRSDLHNELIEFVEDYLA